MGKQVREFWQALRNTPEAFRLVWSASRRGIELASTLDLVLYQNRV
jgi:hypothetical protein